MGWSKFKAVRTKVNGINFASKLEAAVYLLLLQRQTLGEIKDIKCQYVVLLREKCQHCGAEEVKWRVDFAATLVKTNEVIYIEAKGNEDETYRKKKKLWKLNPPGRLEIYKGSYQKPRLFEVIQ